MAGLHFDFTADNSNFVQRMNEIRSSVDNASKVIDKLGKNFDVSTTENKILSLGKVIRDNETAIESLSKEMRKWANDAKEAFNNGDFETFQTITKDIEDQQVKINELTQETRQYYQVLGMIQQSADTNMSPMVTVTAPMYFSNQNDYEYAERLKEKIAELQEQIAQFDGSEQELQPLRDELTGTQTLLYEMQNRAAEAASALGEDLGGRAAEASQRLYELNDSVQKQEEVVQALSIALEEAANNYDSLIGSGDTQAIDDARIKYEMLSVSVQNAQNELFNLKASQEDASNAFEKINGEISQHDSLMVKMLGGYGKYQAILGNLPGPAQGVISSINGMTGAAKAFLATPLGAVIGAIVLALQALKKWFTSTEEGQRAFAKISGFVSGVLDQLMEIVIALGGKLFQLGKVMFKAFANPKQAVIDLWNAIKNNIMVRIKSIGDAFTSLGKIVSSALQFKWDDVKENAKNMGKSIADAFTGVEGTVDKVGKAVDKVGDKFSDMAKKVKRNIKVSEEEMQIEIDEGIEAKETARRNKEMAALRADLRSKDKETRRKAIEEYKRLSEEQMNADLAMQDRKIAVQQAKIEMTSTSNEDRKKLRELEAGRLNIEAQNEQRKAMLARFENGLTSGISDAQIASKMKLASQKVIDLVNQQAEERLRLEQEKEFEIWQNRINLMDEGEEKVLAQMKLNNSKELIALEQQKNDAIKAEISRQKALFDANENDIAAGNKNYGKKVFNDANEELKRYIETLEEINKIEKELDNPNIELSDTNILAARLAELSDEKAVIQVKLGDVDSAEIDKIISQYSVLQSQLTDIQAKAEQDRLDRAKEDMNNYLKEYGNYQQKVNAIKEEYDNKYSAAENDGQRLAILAERDKVLADLDFSEWIDTGDLSLAFGDISKLSEETINGLIANMEAYRSKIIATFDPEKIQKFEEALSNLHSAKTDFSFTFGEGNDLVAVLKERLAIQQQIAELDANQIALSQQKLDIETQLNALKEQGVFSEDEKGNVTYNEGVSKESIKNAQQLQVKLNDINKALQQSTKRSQELNSQLQTMKSVKFSDVQKFSQKLLIAGKNAAELASIFGDDLADAIGEGIDKLGGMFNAFQELSSNIDVLANSAKNIVKETTDASQQLVDAASGGMKASAAATATSLSTMEKASAILAIIGAAIQLATMIASLFNSDKKHEKNIQNLQKQIDALQNSYDRLGRAVAKTFSTDASKLIEQQNTLLKQQKVLIQQQMREEMMKKNGGDEKKLEEYKKALQEIENQLEDNIDKAKEAIIGEDIKSAINEFSSALSAAWENNTDAANASMQAVKNIIISSLSETLKKNIQPLTQSFYDKLAEFMQKGYLTEAELRTLDDLKAQIDAIAEIEQEKYEKILERYKDIEELREELTDVSFDSVRDNFKSLLSDMGSSASDFSNNLTDMLRNAMIEGLMQDKYDIMLKEWYDEFAEAMTDHTLTDEERNSLKQKYDAIVQQGLEDRNLVNDIVGGSAYSQKASTGNAWNMNQETGEELSGRFTALVELEAINNTLVSEGNTYLRDILANMQSITGISMIPVAEGNDTTLLAIKDMLFLSTGFLEDIAKYTKNLNNMSLDINEMKNAINKL